MKRIVAFLFAMLFLVFGFVGMAGAFQYEFGLTYAGIKGKPGVLTLGVEPKFDFMAAELGVQESAEFDLLTLYLTDPWVDLDNLTPGTIDAYIIVKVGAAPIYVSGEYIGFTSPPILPAALFAGDPDGLTAFNGSVDQLIILIEPYAQNPEPLSVEDIEALVGLMVNLSEPLGLVPSLTPEQLEAYIEGFTDVGISLSYVQEAIQKLYNNIVQYRTDFDENPATAAIPEGLFQGWILGWGVDIPDNWYETGEWILFDPYVVNVPFGYGYTGRFSIELMHPFFVSAFWMGLQGFDGHHMAVPIKAKITHHSDPFRPR